jgi:hypothetical protein
MTPIILPLPPDVARCLAHGDKVGDWCDLRYRCARHETIKYDAPRIHAADTKMRACTSETMAGFLPIEGFPDAEEES